MTVNVTTDSIKSKDVDFYSPFDMVIATDLDLATLSTINAACRLSDTAFYASGTHGFYGYIFADLRLHEYVIEREKSNRPTALISETATRSIIATSTKKQDGKVVEMVTKREMYTPIILANTSPLPPEITNSRRRKLQVPLFSPASVPCGNSRAYPVPSQASREQIWSFSPPWQPKNTRSCNYHHRL